MPTVAIIVIAIVLCLALVYFNYRHNHRFSFDEKKLHSAINGIFDNATNKTMPKKVFVVKLKQALSCTQKEALYLYGEAVSRGFITAQNNEVGKGE